MANAFSSIPTTVNLIDSQQCLNILRMLVTGIGPQTVQRMSSFSYSSAPQVGELAGSTGAAQMPSVTCDLVMLKAVFDNAGRVYIGNASVTVKDGTTDTTTGFELSAGEQTPWLFVQNANQFYRICDNAGDDLTYIAFG